MDSTKLKEHAVNKWQTIVDGGIAPPSCAYCDAFTLNEEIGNCGLCPLNIIGEQCYKDSSVYVKFADHQNDSHLTPLFSPNDTQLYGECCKPFAQAVLDALKKAPAPKINYIPSRLITIGPKED